jgi:ATP-dependent RNA helicase RhlE
MAENKKNFEDFGFNKQILSALEALNYEEPTPIQQKAIPVVLSGQDILGIAQTGTGKTAAYVLPLLMKIKYAQGVNPRALIVAPTRELAMQINENISTLAQFCDIRHTAIYGGTGMKGQIETVNKGIDILVATPGRLMDIYLKGELVLKDLKVLVLDEADKMMDMGFMPQIRKLLEVIPRKRQNLLFSATMPEKVVNLSAEFLEYPTVVEVAPQATTTKNVDQSLYALPNLKTKINFLLYLLTDKEKLNRVIIFTKTKETANNITKYLERKIYNDVRVVHANKDQNARTNAMESFRQGEVRILVATDVAARGLDISNVSHVINFDVPIIYEDYVHRIGRTGRAQQLGEAITFMTPAEKYHIEKIEKIIRMQIPLKPLPEDLVIEATPFDESQAIAREIDDQRKKEDPTFQGAFHEKKVKPGARGKSKPGSASTKTKAASKSRSSATTRNGSKTGSPSARKRR